jgi:hypothetical protein
MAVAIREVLARLPDPALAGADWADAYQVETPLLFPTARAGAEAIVRCFPAWTMSLLLLRKLVVLPLGLKGGDRVRGLDMVGIFPVASETPARLVGGFDDRHLDFRVIVELSSAGPERQRIKLTTVVRRHNRTGRTFLAAVMPFHRAIIRRALRRLVTG